MPKRFTDTEKYKNPFIRGLSGPYKLLWDYLYHNCNHAGIWVVDFEIAQIYLGSDMPVNKDDALAAFNCGQKRIFEFCGSEKWFIKSFVEFQYGQLNDLNRVHNSVIKEISKYDELSPLLSPLQGVKDKDKDKDKDKIKVPFLAPTVDEVVECIKEYANAKSLIVTNEYCGITAEGFVEHYENCGWKLSSGRGALMKNWKLALKKFVRTDFSSGKLARRS